jgi:hypothetical protein
MIRLFLVSVILSFALLFRWSGVLEPVPALRAVALHNHRTGEKTYFSDGFIPEEIQYNGIAYGPVNEAIAENPQSPKVTEREKKTKKVKSPRKSGSSGPVYQFLGMKGSRITLNPDERIFVPFLGQGFFKYYKAGQKVFYFSPDGETLWEKDFAAYPLTDNQSTILLLITGDGNRIDIMDKNGNPAGDQSVSGNILTQIRFAEDSSDSCIVFGTGGAFVLNSKGTVRFSWKSESQESFSKSCNLSNDGKWAALHVLENGKDKILVFQNDKKFKEIILPGIYPHNLYFSLNDHGVWIATPERHLFFSFKGDSEQTYTVYQDAISVYRPVFAGADYFLAEDGHQMVVADRHGHLLHYMPLPKGVFRFMSAGNGKNLIAVQHGADLAFYMVSEK